MSVSLRASGRSLVYYTDLDEGYDDINEVHGAEAVNGMRGLMRGAKRRPGAGAIRTNKPRDARRDVRLRDKRIRTSTITDLMFGSVTDVPRPYLPDREKHGALRGMLSLLACNTTYRGPATPGTAAALAYGFAVPTKTR